MNAAECFEYPGFVENLLLVAAEQGDWGTVWSMLCVSRTAFRWAYSVGKSKRTGRRQLGAQKMLADLLGSRNIEHGLDFDGCMYIRYYERGERHRIRGPAVILYDHAVGKLTLMWMRRGHLEKTLFFDKVDDPRAMRVLMGVPETLKVLTESSVYTSQWHQVAALLVLHHQSRGNRTFSAHTTVLPNDSESVDIVEAKEKNAFFDAAYDALDASQAERQRKRKARTAALIPTRRRLIKRSDDSE